MKTLIALALLCLASCTTVTTTAPDGTVTTTKSLDVLGIHAIGEAVAPVIALGDRRSLK